MSLTGPWSRQIWWIFAGSCAIYAALACYFLTRSLAIGDGTPIYYLDDAYIHMAMARTLAETGIYGVTPYAVTTSSTSPVWVLILALGFLLTGSNIYVPMAVAALACIGALAIAIRILATTTTTAVTAVSAIALVLLVPLPLLTSQGMEHALHIAAMLAACWWVARRASDPAPPPLWIGAALFAVLPLLRWESLWLAALSVALMLWRRRWRDAAVLVIATIVPICIYGFWSMSQGWPFMPASVVTKTMVSVPLDYWNLKHILGVLFYHPLMKFLSWRDGMGLAALMLIVASALAWRFYRRESLWQAPVLFRALVLVGAWMHAVGGSFGWGYRYEAYMYALGIVAMALSAEDLADLWRAARRRSAATAAATVLAVSLLAIPVGIRAFLALDSIVRNMQLVLDRDHYPARLMAANFPGEAVVGSNLGALAWYHNGDIVDLFGLGTREIAQFTLAAKLRTPQIFDAWARAHNAKLAIMFEAEFEFLAGGRPDWIYVARVEVVTIDLLHFGLYAKDEETARRLARAIKNTPVPRGSADTVRLIPPYDRP